MIELEDGRTFGAEAFLFGNYIKHNNNSGGTNLVSRFRGNRIGPAYVDHRAATRKRSREQPAATTT